MNDVIEFPDIVRVLVPLDPKIIRVLIAGIPGPPGNFINLGSIAELRAFAGSVFDDLIFVKSWHAGLRLGGGYFQRDGADTTSPDDGGLIIVDAVGRRWRRLLAGNRISPTMFGARGQRGVDDTVAVNAVFAHMRVSVDETIGMGSFHFDDEGLVFDCSGSINATAITGGNRNCSLGRLAINSKAAGKIAVDLTGSQFYRIDELTVRGDNVTPPAVGVFMGRVTSPGIPHPTADRGHIVELEAFGTFLKAAFMNLAAEVYRIDFLRVSNNYYKSNAAVSIIAGSSAVIDNFCGMPTSDFQTIGLGDQSLSCSSIGQHIAQRNPAYLYSVSVSKANPAVVTMAVADMAAAIAQYGLANGASVYLTTTGDSTGAGNWSNRNGLVWPVQDLNAAAGTFRLTGMDTTGVTDNLVHAEIRNDTGPAVVFGHLGIYREFNGYYTAFSKAKIRLDARTGPDTDRNWIIEIAARHELGSPHLIEIFGDDQLRFIRGLKIKSDNENSNISPIVISGCSGAGKIICTNIDWEFAHNAQSPLQLVTNPQFLDIRGGKMTTLSNSLSITAEPDESEFGEAVFDLVRPGFVPRVRHYGDRLFTGVATFLRKTANQVAIRAECTEESAAPGPLVDLKRTRTTPAAGDFIGSLRYIGRDSAGADIAYVFMRAIAKTIAAGSQDGQLDVHLAANGTLNSRVMSLNRFGLQGGARTEAISTDANFTLTSLSSAIQIFHTGTLTAHRDATLAVVGSFDGCRFRIARTGADAFLLNVKDGAAGLIKALPAASAGEFVFDGAAGRWRLAAYGTL
jgi:hypothetical protein